MLRLRVRIGAALYARQIGDAHCLANAPGELLVAALAAFERLGLKFHKRSSRCASPVACDQVQPSRHERPDRLRSADGLRLGGDKGVEAGEHVGRQSNHNAGLAAACGRPAATLRGIRY